MYVQKKIIAKSIDNKDMIEWRIPLPSVVGRSFRSRGEAMQFHLLYFRLESLYDLLKVAVIHFYPIKNTIYPECYVHIMLTIGTQCLSCVPFICIFWIRSMWQGTSKKIPFFHFSPTINNICWVGHRCMCEINPWLAYLFLWYFGKMQNSKSFFFWSGC